MKFNRKLLTALGISLGVIAFSAFYALIQLNIARSKGIYETAEQGMLAYTEKYYSPDSKVDILLAGPNSFVGRQPYYWYVIAEVNGISRTDGSKLRYNGCESIGLSYLQTKKGWVYIPDGAFPGIVGFWIKVFGMAGEGQTTPSKDLLPDHTYRFCNGKGGVYYGRPGRYTSSTN
jgi:hypothetical protein